jgi:hypothetical protein
MRQEYPDRPSRPDEKRKFAVRDSAPRTRQRWSQRTITVGTVAALAVAGLLIFIGAKIGGGGASYKGTDLETDVERTISDNGGGQATVTCPSSISVKKDAIVDCMAAQDGEDIGIRVTFNDAKGHFTIERESLPSVVSG